MLRIFLLSLLVLLSGPGFAQQRGPDAGSAIAGNRLALVIGNDAYTVVPRLRSARADAQSIAAALRGAGFEVMLRTDVDDQAMRAAVSEFIGSLSTASEVMFYFGGHGVQLGATNYLLPTNARADVEHVRGASLELRSVLDGIGARQVRFSAVVVDACRDSPFAGIPASETDAFVAPPGQMVAFASSAGKCPLENVGPADRDPNGVYMRALLKAMRRVDWSLDEVFRKAGEEVGDLTRPAAFAQLPTLYDATSVKFYLHPVRR